MTAYEYTKQNEFSAYLPDFLKDFHDQKDFFKCMDDFFKDTENFRKLPNSWVENHVFCIDFFLFFLSLHGYKLQKIRAKDVEFYDINQTTKEYKNRLADAFSAALSDRLNERNKSN